jgi:hypothetical protein
VSGADGATQADRLEAAVSELLSRADGLSADLLLRDPGPEDWSAMKVLAHVAEYLGYWSVQAAAVASRATDGEPFGRTHDDPARIVAVQRHAHDALSEVRPRIDRAVREAARVLRTIPEAGWARSGTHPRRGVMTVSQIVDAFILEHTDEHLAQLDSSIVAARSAS